MMWCDRCLKFNEWIHTWVQRCEMMGASSRLRLLRFDLRLVSEFSCYVLRKSSLTFTQRKLHRSRISIENWAILSNQNYKHRLHVDSKTVCKWAENSGRKFPKNSTASPAKLLNTLSRWNVLWLPKITQLASSLHSGFGVSRNLLTPLTKQLRSVISDNNRLWVSRTPQKDVQCLFKSIFFLHTGR